MSRPRRVRWTSRATAIVMSTLIILPLSVMSPPAEAQYVPPYQGQWWMPRVALVGDSFTFLSGAVFQQELEREWWRTSQWAFGGARTEHMRDQIRVMAADRPDAFILQLGGNDTVPLLTGEYDWQYERRQIAGILDDIQAAGVRCVVWAGPNEHFDDGPVDVVTKRINDEIRLQLAVRGIGVYADWTPIADAHPEYSLFFDRHLTPAGEHAYGRMLGESLRNCARNPRGSFDGATPGVGVRVQGWTFDPDTPGPNDVHVYIDGAFAGSVTASSFRPDVAAAFPVTSFHGFDATFAVGAGAHRVCIFAINVGYGLTNPVLGCRNLVVDGSPSGFVDGAVGGSSSIRAQGWAIDSDTASPVDVHVYVDGVGQFGVAADVLRGDLGIAFPPYGANHGFDVTVGGLTPGRREICVYGINAAMTPGGHRLLGCRTVTVT
jgi:hypothetical protein